jgi:hypothetical protein
MPRPRRTVDDAAEAVPYLRRPFTPEAIKFKVQSVFGMHLGLPDRRVHRRAAGDRTAQPRDGTVVGEVRGGAGSKLMVCRLTVGGITREDVGESPKGLSKDLYSDALKRAAVTSGSGVSVYALAQVRINWTRRRAGSSARRGLEETVVLTDQGHEWLKGG